MRHRLATLQAEGQRRKRDRDVNSRGQNTSAQARGPAAISTTDRVYSISIGNQLPRNPRACVELSTLRVVDRDSGDWTLDAAASSINRQVCASADSSLKRLAASASRDGRSGRASNLRKALASRA